MKNSIKSLALGAFISLAFIACGGGGGSSSSDAKISTNEVKLIDGYIKDALVKDSNGQTAKYTTNGTYIFANKPEGKIYVYGGEFEDSNVKNKFDYVVDARYKIISPITHYISKYPAQKDSFLKALELDEKDIDENFVERLKQDEKKNDVIIAKTSQILYALETNDYLKELQNVTSYEDMYKKALELAKNNPDASSLIKKANSMSKDELINAENNLAQIKSSLYITSSKQSGIRLEGSWKLVGTTTQCDKNLLDLADVKITYDKHTGYHIKNYNHDMLGLGICTITKFKKSDYGAILESDYANVKYPLPISEFKESKELPKLFVNTEFRGDTNIFDKVELKFISPDTFSNTSTYGSYKYTAIYKKVDTDNGL